ncbi:hypothetical protein LMG3412_06479 [Achromobacter deleyi]|nr:hypothetical protein LMG3412_06479 [Achromobacter deleyi]
MRRRALPPRRLRRGLRGLQGALSGIGPPYPCVQRRLRQPHGRELLLLQGRRSRLRKPHGIHRPGPDHCRRQRPLHGHRHQRQEPHHRRRHAVGRRPVSHQHRGRRRAPYRTRWLRSPHHRQGPAARGKQSFLQRRRGRRTLRAGRGQRHRQHRATGHRQRKARRQRHHRPPGAGPADRICHARQVRHPRAHAGARPADQRAVPRDVGPGRTHPDRHRPPVSRLAHHHVQRHPAAPTQPEQQLPPQAPGRWLL